MLGYPDYCAGVLEMTVFEHIEKLKRDYTDKFVLVDDRCAELARFKGQTGRVKTVNMNGRALVEFDHYANIGWFDIGVDYLKVIDRPPPKKEVAKASSPAAKATPTKTAPSTAAATEDSGKQLSPLEMARMQDSGGGKTAAAPEKASSSPASAKRTTADILAAARGKKPAAADPPLEKKAKLKSASPSSEKPVGEMTLAEKLAAARGEAGSGVAPPNAEDDVAAENVAVGEKEAGEAGEAGIADAAEAEVAETQVDSEEVSAVSEPTEVVDRSTMSVDEMIAWCRNHDGA
jgi:hypothetical protein